MIYRFGECEVDTKLIELRRAGEVRPMDPLGFDLLKYLIENRDRVLTRNELFDTLWPGKVVTDSALSSRLKSVRHAVGDNGSAQNVIKTVHGRGYRFVADLANAPDALTEPRPGAGFDIGITKTSAVGRDTELGKLSRWLDRATGGYRSVVFITGEAGVGKTTLTRAFLGAAQDQTKVFVLHGQCVNQRGASEPYLPLLEALGRAGRHDPAVTAVLRHQAPAWLAQLPALQLDPDDTVASAPAGVTTGRMLRELSELLDSLAQQRTIVLVLEDLHWSDPSTIGWLEYYARRHDPARLLLIATLRPDGPFHMACRELSMRGHAHELQLGPIDEADISDYLNQRLDHPPTPLLAELTFHRTGGFPMFIDTLVDHWLENGLVRKANGIWVAAADDQTLLAGVPESLSQLIDQQLANLIDDERQLLETAALAGSPFAAAAIAAALGDSDENIEALYGHLARQGRIIRNAKDLHWPDGTVTATFEFRHELYREALYSCVEASRRSRLHRALGERLEKAYGEQPGPAAGEIADHFARAHEVDRALRYFYPAALLSFNRSAYRETVDIVNRALTLIETLSESANTLKIERDLLLLRGSALISLEGWSSRAVEDSYLRARSIAERLGIKDSSPEVYGLAALHENRGRYTESQAVIESLLQSSPELALEGHELLACSLFHQGRFDQSKANADRAAANYDPEQVSVILARYGENPGVSCHNWAALDLWFMGYPDSALLRSDRAMQLAEGHVYSSCSARALRTFLHQFRNDLEDTVLWAEQTRTVAEKQGFDYRIAQIMILGAWARGRLAHDEGEQQQALDTIELGIRRHITMGSEMDLPYQLTLKADLLVCMGRLDQALTTQQEAFESNPEGRDFFYEAEMHRLYASLLLRINKRDTDRAEESLDQSLHLARRQGARMLELRTCLSRCQIANGADSARRADLEQVLGTIEEGHDTPDWQAAQAWIQGQSRVAAGAIGRRPQH